MPAPTFEKPPPLLSDRDGSDRSRSGRRRRPDDCNATFEAFYEADYRSVVGLGYVLCGNRNLAEDLAQEAFAEAHRRWARVGRYDKPGAWVRRVMINRSRGRWRRSVVETRGLTLLAGRRPDICELPEQSDEVWTAVRALPTRQAQVIALRFWDELSIGEIAEVLVCGSETVKTHLKRAKATLAIELETERSLSTAC